MKNDKIKELYYTAGEAREVLDLSDDKFQYWVKAGRIEKVLLPGRAQYLYPRRSVDRLARRIEAAIIADSPEGLDYRKARIEDLQLEYELSHLIFGKNAHTVAIRKKYMEKNPDIDYHLYDTDKLAAFINVIPFTKETIQAFISGEKRGHELDPNTILPFVPGQPLECIVMEMATTPTVPPERRTIYGSQLIMGFAETLGQWGEQGVIINKLHATSSTPTGQRICRSAGFQVVHDFENGRLAFELDLNTSNAKILREYREGLENRKNRENLNNLMSKETKKRTSSKLRSQTTAKTKPSPSTV